ncbi:hypothetical protein N7474_004473 [Penicillium riverlandense]|uniref:uncharacterized protein n=1 Tax=Penicillium riverlandense TaxID=1903569 RepID=UPI002547F825|nr:uncharacterized protein N7474_004473 [Penicillium riverlandense]KAJ5818882.1 hypothetical protein N7474_004473 [Penicillium riverlandense]
METRNQSNQPQQPPKQAAYGQASNPVSHTPQEQRAPTAPARHYGDAPGSITRRTADSKPSSDEERARLDAKRQQEQPSSQKSPDVDLEYGVEQQPAEGYIADAVERKGMGMRRAQAGAHAGPVGSAAGPGHPGQGEERDLAADMGRKQQQHEKMLGDKVGRSPPAPDHEAAEREAVRERKLKHDESLDVKDAVKEATGEPVVGSR